ncbi:hypothetical protein [Fuerstiella marisgermanici]|nr:hypothetical protein [Fuerstiella marisgermanici]
MPKASKFQKFSVDSDCNQLLPDNKLANVKTLYKIVTFEHDGLVRDLFSLPVLVPLQGVLKSTIPLGLPWHLLTSSEPVHEHTELVDVVAGNLNLAVSNDGTCLPTGVPVSDATEKNSNGLERIVRIQDFASWKGDGIRYRGVAVRTNSRLKRELLENGSVVSSLAEDRKTPVRIILDPADVLPVSNPESLIAGRTLSHCGNDVSVKLSRTQVDRLHRGQGVIFSVAGNPVRIQKTGPGSTIDRPTTMASGAGNRNWFLTVPDEEEDFCIRLTLLRTDPRAETYYRPMENTAQTQSVVDFISGWPDQVYKMILELYLADPRAEACLRHFGNDRPGESGQFPDYQIGLFTTFEQTWEQLGYSRGSLVSSLNLAPGESLNIEVFTWDRRKVEKEQSFAAEYEWNREFNTLAKASTTIARDLKESLDARVEGNGNIGLPGEKVKLNAGVSGGVKGSVKEGLKNDVSLIHEQTTKSAERFKSSYQVKIVETHEEGRERRSVRRIENPNRSRTLTFNYFEVVENFRVVTELKDSAKLCLLVKNPSLGPFDLDFVLAYGHRLKEVLMSSDYRSGFDAAVTIAAQRWFDHRSGIAEPATSVLPLPGAPVSSTQEDAIPPAQPPKGIMATGRIIHDILKQFLYLENRIAESFEEFGDHYNPLFPSRLSAASLGNHRDAIRKHCFWVKLNNVHPGFDKKARAYVDATHGKFSKPESEPEVIAALRHLLEDFDDDWLYTIKMFAASVVVNALFGIVATVFIATTAALLLPILGPMLVDLAYNHIDLGLSVAISTARRDLLSIVDMQNAVSTQRQAEISSVPPAGGAAPVSGPIVSQVPVEVPQVYSHRELAEAHARFEKLILHLEANRTFYANEIWRSEDANERYRRLEILGVARFVQNRLLGFVGDRAAFPLRVESLPPGVNLEGLLPDIAGMPRNDREQQIDEVALPTSSLHIESVVGRCDALEPYELKRRTIDRKVAKTHAALLREQLRTKRIQNDRLAEHDQTCDTPHAG